jgi:hypothetical protein
MLDSLVPDPMFPLPGAVTFTLSILCLAFRGFGDPFYELAGLQP